MKVIAKTFCKVGYLQIKWFYWYFCLVFVTKKFYKKQNQNFRFSNWIKKEWALSSVITLVHILSRLKTRICDFLRANLFFLLCSFVFLKVLNFNQQNIFSHSFDFIVAFKWLHLKRITEKNTVTLKDMIFLKLDLRIFNLIGWKYLFK